MDKNGDIVIQNGNIVMIADEQLTRQTMRTVVGTNKNEWFLNTDEGIDFKSILVKNPDYDVIKSEISDGIKQVDENFILNSFNYSLDKNRNLKIDFEATNGEYTFNESTVDTDRFNSDYESDRQYENDMTAKIKEVNDKVVE